MQDRFKFRYYDEQSRKIYDIDSLYCINDSSSRCASLSVNDNEFLHIGQKLFKPENLMQCTGLKDKNSTLIYEKDIVECNNNASDLAIVRYGLFNPVDMENEMYIDLPVSGWYLEKIKIRPIDELEPFCFDMQLNDFIIKRADAKVIGNIYENPELMEGNNKNAK